jgi:uncharacterized repeat protein (TIGR03803 family)
MPSLRVAHHLSFRAWRGGLILGFMLAAAQNLAGQGWVSPPIIIDPWQPIWDPTANPASEFTWTDGNTYGVSTWGGNNSDSQGEVFEQTPAGNTSVLYSFDSDDQGNYPNGSSPFVLLPGVGSTFYGATSSGGLLGDGTIFALSPDGGNFTTLVDFTGDNGADPVALILGADGNFYGATSNGGDNDDGTLFAMTPAGNLTTLVSFNGDNGANPSAFGQGTDGNFYGTTSSGGYDNDGVIFEADTSGNLASLANLSGVYSGNGLDSSTSDEVLGTDGNLYGVNSWDADNWDSAGTVYQTTPDGNYTTLYSFTPDANGNYTNGAYPFVLLEGANGNFYGATSNGGNNDNGTLFEITASGNLTTLVAFDGGNTGSMPEDLVLGPDGNYYGVTSGGGAGGNGTVFQLTPAGNFTTLYAFTGASDGGYPMGLALGSDGNFYGVTSSGGANGDGTTFSITTTGNLTTLISLNGATGVFYPGVLYAGSVNGSAGKPTPIFMKIKGGSKFKTHARRYKLEGSAVATAGVKEVQIKIGKHAYTKAHGTKSWSVSLALEKGKNTVNIRVIDKKGRTMTKTVVVTRE